MAIPGWARLAGAEAWAHAISNYDKGRTDLLAELVATDFEITPGARAALAEIVAGKRKPDRRGRHLAKLTAFQKREAVAELDFARERLAIYMTRVEWAANQRKVEPKAIVTEINEGYEAGVAMIAASYGITAEYLKNLAKPTRRK